LQSKAVLLIVLGSEQRIPVVFTISLFSGRQMVYEKKMGEFKIPASEIDHRRRCLQQRLQADEIDGLVVVQRVDLLYLSGTAQNAVLYMPAEGDPVLCVRRDLARARAESALEKIVGIDSVRQLPDRILDFHGKLPRRLAMELDVMPVREYEFYRGLFPQAACLDGAPIILQTRQVKSEWELQQMAHTAEMSCRTFAFMQRAMRSGLTEMEFAGIYETFARRLGHGGRLRMRHFLAEAYPWHVLSGENGGKVGLLDAPFSGEGTSIAFPCGAGHRTLAENEPILVDFGAVLNGYHMDETRMFAIGAMPEAALRACRIAIEIHAALIEEIKPGVRAGTIFDTGWKMAARSGHADQYLGPPGSKVSFVGHGIGLELVEPPVIAAGKDDLIEPGMTLALEPKFCFPNQYAAGIESVVRVTDTGAELISRVPVDVFVCDGSPPGS
jgi:Xaa-Pro aminopeptidase